MSNDKFGSFFDVLASKPNKKRSSKKVKKKANKKASNKPKTESLKQSKSERPGGLFASLLGSSKPRPESKKANTEPKTQISLQSEPPAEAPTIGRKPPIKLLLNFYEDGVKDSADRRKLTASNSDYIYYGEGEKNSANIDTDEAEKNQIYRADKFVEALYQDNSILLSMYEIHGRLFDAIPTFNQFKMLCKLSVDKVETIENEDHRRYHEDYKNGNDKDIRPGEYAKSKLMEYRYGLDGAYGGVFFSKQSPTLELMKFLERSRLESDLDSYKRVVHYIIDDLNTLAPSSHSQAEIEKRNAQFNAKVMRSKVKYRKPPLHSFPEHIKQFHNRYLDADTKALHSNYLAYKKTGTDSYSFIDAFEERDRPGYTYGNKQTMPIEVYWHYLKNHKFYAISGTASDPRTDYFLNTRQVKLRFDIFGKTKLKYGNLLTRKDQEHHTYIVGGTGSGKTELLKYIEVQEILKSDRNSIVLDPHGDLAEEIIDIGFLHPHAMKNVIYVDTSIQEKLGSSASNLPCINPLEINRKYVNTREKVESVAHYLSLAFEEITGADNTVNMKAMLVPCLCVLLERKGSTFYDLDRFMDDERNEDLVELGRNSKIPSESQYFHTKFLSKKTNTTKEALSVRLQVMLNSSVFVKMTCGKSTIDFNEVVRSRGTHLIFRLNKENTSSIQKELGILIITAVLNASFSVPKGGRTGTHLLIDEFQNFVYSDMGTILEQARKYKLYMTLAHQFVDQITDTSIKRSILTNANIKIIGSGGGTIVKTLKNNGESNIEQEYVDKLRTGRFLVRIKRQGAFYDYLNVPATVVHKFVKWVDKPTRKAFLQDQYKRFYKGEKVKIETPKAPVRKDEQELDFKDF